MDSKTLSITDVEVEYEVVRLRLDKWRIVYTINQAEKRLTSLQYASDHPTTMAIWSNCWLIETRAAA
jgi:hypothetical protein